MNKNTILTAVVRWSYMALVVAMAAATFVEWQMGTSFVHRHFYGAWWFAVLMAMVVVPGMVIAARRLMLNVPALMVHVSLTVIVAGALATRLTGIDGTLHLRQGETQSVFVDGSNAAHALPFSVKLDTFSVHYYPHTDAPMDYVSLLRIDGHRAQVSMNNVATVGGYRLFQTSYDTDGQGTLLTVNYDPWGMTLSYMGYLMLIASMIAVLANKRGRFRQMIRQLRNTAALLAVAALASCSKPTDNLTVSLPTAEQTEQMAKTDIIYNGRIAPISTYCTDFMLKVTGSARWRGLTGEQVVLAWVLDPQTWQNVPMIKVKDTSAAQQMGICVSNGYTSVTALFDENNNYRLARYLDGHHKAASDLNDRLQAIIALTDGTAFRATQQHPHPWLRRAEIIYNRIQPTSLLFKLQLTLALIVLAITIAAGIKGRRPNITLTAVLMTICTVLQTAALATRGIIAGCWPLSNGYETMLFMALAISIGALMLLRTQALLASLCMLMSGFALLVAHIGISNPHITPLMPVLHSPWLSVHVASVMMAYALFSIVMLNGVVSLLTRNNTLQQFNTSMIMLYVAQTLLAAGIFIGAVWANQSWGRYWGWDPKEVWALITLLVYAVPLHPSLAPSVQKPRNLHIYTIAAFATVLMTYFGVNYLLGGMHSYAG